MKAVVLRGISGSGKSTYASRFRNARVFSNDNFFVRDGAYQFDPMKLGEAGQNCLREFIEACRRKSPLLIVDNTNCKIAELAPYMACALAYGYDATLVSCVCDVETAQARNIHGVPLKSVEKQLVYFDEATKLIPPYWKHEIFDTRMKR